MVARRDAEDDDLSWQHTAACRGETASSFSPPIHFERKELRLARERNDDFAAIARQREAHFHVPRTRLYSSTRQDGDRAISRSLNFGGLRQINGGTGTAWDNTTVVIQDSLA